MAHILFGVAGEGSGHSSRARVIIDYLQKKGHTVKVVTYHKGVQNLSSDYDVEEVFGLRFTYRDNKVAYPKTVLENIKKFPEATKSFAKVKKLVKEFNPDYVLSDFEPLTALVAHINNIPLISIDNQHRITHGKLEFEKKWMPEYMVTKAGVASMVFKANYYIITSFFDFKTQADNVYVIPSILREDVLNAQTSDKGHVLVYTTSGFDACIPEFKKRNETFVIYGFDKEGVEGNCIFKKSSKHGFLNDLLDAHCIIASAGLTLMSEAIYLQKPYLALPVKGQFEQLVNAYYLKKYNYGSYLEEFTVNGLQEFLNKRGEYKVALAGYKQDGNTQLYTLLDTLIT